METKEEILKMIRKLSEKDELFLKQLKIIIKNHLKKKGRR